MSEGAPIWGKVLYRVHFLSGIHCWGAFLSRHCPAPLAMIAKNYDRLTMTLCLSVTNSLGAVPLVPSVGTPPLVRLSCCAPTPLRRHLSIDQSMEKASSHLTYAK